MTRTSGKTIITKPIPTGSTSPSDFNLIDFESAIRDKGNFCIFQKAHICPCKSEESDHRNVCKSCGGTGWLFVNPTKTKMLVSALVYNKRFEVIGAQDSGTVSITALNEDKLSFMDRITLLDSTGEYSQLLYPKLTDNGTQLFAYSKYDILAVDFIGLFVASDQKLKRLVEITDYTWRDNVLLLGSQYNNLVDQCVTIRYTYHPIFHIIDIPRESMTSYKHSLSQGQVKLVMPVHAIAQRAHLIKDVENYDGNRLLDNSWLPNTCAEPEITQFNRMLRYMAIQDIYNNLTEGQKVELDLLLQASDSILGANGGILQIAP